MVRGMRVGLTSAVVLAGFACASLDLDERADIVCTYYADVLAGEEGETSNALIVHQRQVDPSQQQELRREVDDRCIEDRRAVIAMQEEARRERTQTETSDSEPIIRQPQQNTPSAGDVAAYLHVLRETAASLSLMSDAELTAIGREVCRTIGEGNSREQVAAHLATRSDQEQLGISEHDIGRLVVAADNHLC